MQIEKFEFSTLNTPRNGTDVIPHTSAPSADASFFTSMLDGPTAIRPTAAIPAELTLLTEPSKHIADMKDRLARALKSSSKGMDADAFREYPRELSNVALTTQLLVKSVGKTSQCIDKICNLQ
ncbi:EscI/YscI/HrpB family type III secretion system inner rod protein [Pseudomonas sp. FJ2-5-13]|uniref:EscI/YscI/HrpB family type III secretion system inner rod protein n=1 Tax=Pseudomonas sp. FJ2-5-13 TaxID=2976884 RepID=UPI0023D8061B|nr:EscI/YscI/HrpB family type III secretion system inner rod protein [Pseudomonas sp. FJ2-5-13]WEJ06432.1 EscI/YscI/HrpB family type III secretion system inner rod protein [Pseudomonas sp. FJ2-5-13]